MALKSVSVILPPKASTDATPIMKQPTLISTILLTATLTVNAAQERPNILFFLVDDMGTQDTSVPFHFDQDGQAVVTESNKLFRTPNMETLARNGRRFTKAYAYSVCSPTRVSLMTGQAAPRHHVTTWTHPASSTVDTGKVRTQTVTGPEWRTTGIPSGIPLLTTELQKAGYTTLFAGKAHFGPDDTSNGDPINLGFDVSIAGFGGGAPGSYYGDKNYSGTWRGGGHQWDIPGLETYHGTDTFLTEALTLEMNAAISKAVEGDQPFFAYMSHYAVHAPFETDARFAQNYPTLKGSRLAFATLVEGMDKSLGDMVTHLETLGVAEDTLIIFYSDNGSAGPFKSAPLRGMKGHRHEGGIRVPLIAAWAKPNPENRFQKQLNIPANSVDDDLVSCVDIMPTFLNIAGGTVPSGTIQDGQSILQQIAGKPGAHRPPTFLAHFPHGQHNNNLFTSYINGDWKVIYNYADKTWELYNQTNDIGEAHNLVKVQPERARTLAKQMLAELNAQHAQYPNFIKDGKPALPDLNSL